MLQARLQLRERGERWALLAAVEPLGRQEVRVHQTGEQHADQEGLAEAWVAVRPERPRRLQRGRRGKLARIDLPAGVVLQRLLARAPLQFRIVGEPRMVARDGIGEEAAEPLTVVERLRFPGAGSGVVRSLAAVRQGRGDIGLISGGHLTDIVQTAGDHRQLGPAERRGEVPGAASDFIEVLLQRLPVVPRGVGGGVGEQLHRVLRPSQRLMLRQRPCLQEADLRQVREGVDNRTLPLKPEVTKARSQVGLMVRPWPIDRPQQAWFR